MDAENTPAITFNNTPKPVVRRRRRSRSVIAAKKASKITQLGDASLWTKENAHTAEHLVNAPSVMVKPGDFTYKHDPTRQFKPYLYLELKTEASEAEYDLLISKGYFKATTEDFESPRFKVTDGVFRTGTRGIWMMQPKERMDEEAAKAANQNRRFFEGVSSGLEAEGQKAGVEAYMRVASDERAPRK